MYTREGADCQHTAGLHLGRGLKYGLTKFLEAAAEFCARIDFDLLNGKTFDSDDSDDENECIDISLKFSKIDLKTQYAISKKRLQRMEMYRRQSKLVRDDYTIKLHNEY